MPIGSIPRTFTAIAKGENVRNCIPGDIIRIEGCLETTTASNMIAQINMLHSLFVDVFKIEKEKKKNESLFTTMETESKIKELVENHDFPSIYNNLAKSLAPEIYGMLDVKKALLLLLGLDSS